MTNQHLEYYNWGQDVERVFAGVPMNDAFGAIPHYTDSELYELGFSDRDDALDKLAIDYTITEQDKTIFFRYYKPTTNQKRHQYIDRSKFFLGVNETL